MSAIEDGTPVAKARRHGTLPAGVLVLTLAAAGYAITLLVFYPGYITVDAQYVYADAQAGRFGDWQSPAMGVLWLIVEPIAPGALGMFLVTASLYWLGFGLLALVAARRSPTLALLSLLAAFAPPAFFFVGLIWRDILFGVVWLAAAVLVLAMVDRDRRVRRCAQAAALLLVTFGILLRPNAIIAAPFLASYVIWPARFDLRRMAIFFMPALLLSYAVVPAVYYGLLDAKRQNPLHSVFVFDLGGITHFTGENQFPVTWTPEQTAQLSTSCYNPVWWDSYWHVPPCPFVMQRLERADDVIFGTPRLLAAWRHALIAHPLAYLRHRATFMWQFLARSNLVLPVWDWQKPEASYGRRPAFKALLALHEVLQPTLIFRPGLWLLLAIAALGCGWRVRASPAGAFAVGTASAAVVYVLTFFLVGVAADFRYAYWCVLATLAAGIAAALARHARGSAQAGEPAPGSVHASLPGLAAPAHSRRDDNPETLAAGSDEWTDQACRGSSPGSASAPSR